MSSRSGSLFRDEQHFQDEVMMLAKAMGMLAYHPFRSMKSVPGFPDTVIVGHRGLLFRELKMPKGVVSSAQAHWIAALTEAGCDAGVWRPEHWPVIITEEIRALGRLVTPPPTPTQAEIRRRLSGGRGGG
jgi:hypothetical protein